MNWATLPGPGETEALHDAMARAEVADIPLGYAVIRALILWSTQAPPVAAHPASAILQFWDQPAPPADVLASMESWHRAGPPVMRFCDETAVDWLRTHYGAEVLEHYLHCHHPAMRSDLFRLAWLLRQGGLYIDADDAFIGDGPLPDFERGLVLLPLAIHGGGIVPVEVALHAGDAAGFFVNNAPLFATPGHPVMETALNAALAHLHGCAARGERGDIHEHTGPSNLNRALVDHLIRSDEAPRVVRAGDATDEHPAKRT